MVGLSHGFRAFLATQFLGAFNDNLFKGLILFLAASVLFPGRDVQGLAMAVFALPFVLFSGLAGELSERFSKQRIMVWMKWGEIALMLFGVLAFQQKSWVLLLVTLFIMGAQSAFFGPPKYGGIPELVPSRDLLRANGLVTMTTFVAVLLGGALAGPILDAFHERLWVLGAACTVVAVLGTWTALRIPRLAPTDPERPIHLNPFRDLGTTLVDLRKRPGVLPLVLLNSSFYFNASVVQMAIIGLGAPSYLDIGPGEKKLLSLVVATLSVAVGLGALLAPRVARRVAPGQVVFWGGCLTFVGQLGFNGVGTLLQRDSGALWLMHGSALWVGICGAGMIVPVAAFLQYLPRAGTRGRTFGLTNFCNWIAIFLAAACYQAGVGLLGWSPALVQTLSGGLLLAAVWFNRGRLRTLRIQ